MPSRWWVVCVHRGHAAPRQSPCLLIGATTVSLVGNIAHAVLPYIPCVVIQISAAAVPPVALLAAINGIAFAIRAGASGRVYRWAVSAVAAIGAGAFAASFLALRDLMRAVGYSSATAWIFPAIIDTAVAVSTMGSGQGPGSFQRAHAPVVISTCPPEPEVPVRASWPPGANGNTSPI